MKKSPMTILACLLLASPLASQTPDAATYFGFLSGANRQTLLAKGELTATGRGSADLPLGSASPLAAQIRAGLSVAGSTVAIEGFFLFPRPAGDVTLGLYNAVNAVASMEGLQYYSVSAGKMETLVVASYRVTGLENPQRLPDPVFQAVPAAQTAVVFQKDNKLGDGYNELTWRTGAGGSLVLTVRNLKTLNFAFLPLVDPGNLQMVFVVVPLSDRVAVYGQMEGKTVSLLGLERSKDESFRNRMRALASWLGTRIASLH